jgi:hypothetical protein
MSTEYFIQQQHNIHSSQQAHGTFSKTYHILGHKASFINYKKKEITPRILSDHNTLELEFNNKNSSRKYVNKWRLNNTLLNDQ